MWDFKTFFLSHDFLNSFFLLRVCVCVRVFDSSPRSPPLPLPLLLLSLLLLSCVPANAEQLDAQVVRPLLLFQVLDFITNSVGGGSKCVCVCVCWCVCVWLCGVGGGVLSTSVGLFERVDETRVPAEFLHGAARLRQETSGEEIVSLRSFFLSNYSSFILFVRVKDRSDELFVCRSPCWLISIIIISCTTLF